MAGPLPWGVLGASSCPGLVASSGEPDHPPAHATVYAHDAVGTGLPARVSDPGKRSRLADMLQVYLEAAAQEDAPVVHSVLLDRAAPFAVDDKVALVRGIAHEPAAAARRILARVMCPGAYGRGAGHHATIRMHLPISGRVSLVVYDVMGRKVATLLDGSLPAGRHDIAFDGSSLASGVYLYRLLTAGTVFSGRMTLLK